MLIRKILLNNELQNLLTSFFPEQPPLLFDIETTGLSRRRSHLYLLGAVSRSADGWQMTQWFLDRPTEEKELLESFSSYINSFPKGTALVHFNGDTFDVPYLRFKYTFYGLEDPLADFESLDLYRKIRPMQKILGLSSMRQKDLEIYLDADREDEMSGGELIDVYQRFIQTRDDELLSLLFLHNHDDLEGMIRILPLLGLSGLAEGKFTITELLLTDAHLLITLQPQFPLPTALRLQEPAQLPDLQLIRDVKDPNRQENEAVPSAEHACSSPLQLLVPVFTGCCKHFFADYKNYYYLPMEDQAIHKDVAVYVDPEYREKAKAATCYQKRNGSFLPQPVIRYEPVFYIEYKTGPALFEYTAGRFSDSRLLHSYACDLLQLFLYNGKPKRE
ncbi:MAG: ribonuclease H-like domain-containing protein [Eubacteriales bacterium]|nr:ribonuclease H-like domain-containing protein [Eubacteriales bacterium]